jgi:hypothetical protein
MGGLAIGDTSLRRSCLRGLDDMPGGSKARVTNEFEGGQVKRGHTWCPRLSGSDQRGIRLPFEDPVFRQSFDKGLCGVSVDRQ